jgi:hypothetical protein
MIVPLRSKASGESQALHGRSKLNLLASCAAWTKAASCPRKLSHTECRSPSIA